MTPPLAKQPSAILYDPDSNNSRRTTGLCDQPYTGTISGNNHHAGTFLFEKEAEYLRQSGYGGHLTNQDIRYWANGPIDNELRSLTNASDIKFWT